MPRITHKAIEQYVRVVSDAMDLADWTFYISWDADMDDHDAHIRIDNPEAKQAYLVFSENACGASKERLRFIVVHEMLHAGVAAYANQTERLVHAMIPYGTLTTHIIGEVHIREEEVVYWLTRLVQPHIPLIKKA